MAVNLDFALDRATDQINLQVTRYLRTVAQQQVKRGVAPTVKSYVTNRTRAAVSEAKRMTQEKYPGAKNRDDRRRPRGAEPHLEDSWTFAADGSETGAMLINTRPKATMLLLGWNVDSRLTPKNRIHPKTGKPVLIFPRFTDGKEWVDKKQLSVIPHTIVRPRPASQASVGGVRNSIPYIALRESFLQGQSVPFRP